MKKKIIFMLSFTCCATNYVTAAAVPVHIKDKIITLPAAVVLQNRLCEEGFGCVCEKTRIVEKLANQEKHPLEVVEVVDQCLGDYSKYLETMLQMHIKSISQDYPEVLKTMIQMNRLCIIKIILQDHPAVIKQLEKDGCW